MALQTKDFSVTKKSAGGGITYTYILRVTENSINKANNTSNVTVKAILKQTYSGTAFYSWYTGVSCSLNGKQIFSDYVQRELSGTSEHVYYTWTGNVAHNADGKLNLKVTGKFWQSSYESYSPPAMTVPEGSMTLTVIPRASTLTATDANIGSVTTVAIQPAATGFTHTLAYSFGSLTGYITPSGTSQTAEKFSQTTVQWKVPTSFYNEIPAKKWAKCTLTCRTYSGSTQIGEAQTTTFLCTAAEANCAPTIVGTVKDINEKTLALTGNENVLIRYHSTAQCTVESQARCGATITSSRVNGSLIVGGIKKIEDVETGSFAFVARDTRDWFGYDTKKLTLIPYTRLTNKPVVTRPNEGENRVVLTVTGKMYRGNFGLAENSMTLTYQINSRAVVTLPVTPDANGYYSITAEMDIDYTTNNTLTVVAKDLLDRVSVKLTVQKGKPVFNWGENFFRFNVPVTCEDSVSGAYIRAVRVWGGSTFRFQSKFTKWDSGGNRQSVFLFGSRNGTAVTGLITVKSEGKAAWAGSGDITVTADSNGALTVELNYVAYDYFMMLSAEPVTVL